MANLYKKNGTLSQWKYTRYTILDFDTWIHYQAPSEGELLSLNDPPVGDSSTAGSVGARRAATSHDVDIYFT